MFIWSSFGWTEAIKNIDYYVGVLCSVFNSTTKSDIDTETKNPSLNIWVYYRDARIQNPVVFTKQIWKINIESMYNLS